MTDSPNIECTVECYTAAGINKNKKMVYRNGVWVQEGGYVFKSFKDHMEAKYPFIVWERSKVTGARRVILREGNPVEFICTIPLDDETKALLVTRKILET